ncbi:MAG: TIGR03564 family F420-dependent LLM class oxidoreductase [Chloroflexi bacterium]|nr:TIGR03564 family F420-dependent LLM class oxidoreductase [Chloroflexota bacterium]
MRIGINVPPAARGRVFSLDDWVDQVAAFAQQGFPSAWFAHIFGFDALTALAVIGRAVSHIELGTAVVPVQPRHPMVLAQQALTTQVAIGGRLVLGLGLSHRPVVESMWGYGFHQPAEYMREYLNILQPLLRGEPVDFAGRQLKGKGQLTLPPVEPPSVLLAALGPRMLRIAGEQSDGTITWMVGPKTLESHVVPVLRSAAQAAGRPEPRIVVGLPVCVTDAPDPARERAARNFARYGELPSYRAMLDREGVAGPADVAVVGSEAEVERQLRVIESAGATDFNANVFGSGPEQERGYEFLRSIGVVHGRGAAV